MTKLYIEGTSRTPEIEFTNGKLRIWGTIVPADPESFYLPLQNWIEKYSNNPAPETVVEIGILYTRGHVMPYLQKLLKVLIMLNNDQHLVTINWYYCMNSIDVKAGKYLSKRINHSFNYIEVEGIW